MRAAALLALGPGLLAGLGAGLAAAGEDDAVALFQRSSAGQGAEVLEVRPERHNGPKATLGHLPEPLKSKESARTGQKNLGKALVNHAVQTVFNEFIKVLTAHLGQIAAWMDDSSDFLQPLKDIFGEADCSKEDRAQMKTVLESLAAAKERLGGGGGAKTAEAKGKTGKAGKAGKTGKAGKAGKAGKGKSDKTGKGQTGETVEGQTGKTDEGQSGKTVEGQNETAKGQTGKTVEGQNETAKGQSGKTGEGQNETAVGQSQNETAVVQSGKTGEGQSGKTGEGQSGKTGEGQSGETGEGQSDETDEGQSGKKVEGQTGVTGEGKSKGKENTVKTNEGRTIVTDDEDDEEDTMKTSKVRPTSKEDKESTAKKSEGHPIVTDDEELTVQAIEGQATPAEDRKEETTPTKIKAKTPDFAFAFDAEQQEIMAAYEGMGADSEPPPPTSLLALPIEPCMAGALNDGGLQYDVAKECIQSTLKISDSCSRCNADFLQAFVGNGMLDLGCMPKCMPLEETCQKTSFDSRECQSLAAACIECAHPAVEKVLSCTGVANSDDILAGLERCTAELRDGRYKGSTTGGSSISDYFNDCIFANTLE